MNSLLLGAALLTLCSCGGQRSREHPDIIGMDSFALASRYGTPASYQHLGEYLQLNYGSAAVGCQVIVLIDQAQRVAGLASSCAYYCGANEDEKPSEFRNLACQ